VAQPVGALPLVAKSASAPPWFQGAPTDESVVLLQAGVKVLAGKQLLGLPAGQVLPLTLPPAV